ncbi:DUF973 family protein [Conexivisphaera calida]|uniref:Uncharacterized protein n=1 Tax=Conexivisphaera calida TaxID=1874277 RepID=A0A4P2VE96_9ARCH|nr:DUF973 family protein [Conexivisphaera calida]BBE42162.1 312aa long conserved hypothetical protein [Conexivisphaera calida]
MKFTHPNEVVSSGARALMWSMIAGIVGGIVEMIAIIAVGASAYLSIGPGALYSGGTGIPPGMTSMIYSMLAVSLGVGIATGVATIALQWIGWSRLRDADRFRYGVGRTGLILLIVGFVLVVVADVVILAFVAPALISYINSIGSSVAPTYPPSYGALGSIGNVAGLLAAAGIAVVGAVLALVGEVMIWIGLWRLDEDYGTGLVRASIILEILAVVVALMSSISALVVFAAMAMAFVSYILIIVGLHGISVRAREMAARGAPSPPASPAPSTPPPPAPA